MTDVVISLLKETHQVDSEGVDHTIITSRAVMCGLKSVSRTDFYSAGQEGLALDHVFVTDPINYDGEKLVVYLGNKYEVTRTYQVSADKLEIYVGHKVGVF